MAPIPMAVGDVSGNQLPICILSRRLVKASDPSVDSYKAAVSNLDRLYANNAQWSMVCLYPNTNLPKGAIDFSGVVASFEAGLPALLSHLYPLAGRIVTDPCSGLPELHCENQGAELVVAEVGATLGSLDYGLATESLQRMKLRFPEDYTFSVQLLSFACGGCAVVWGCNHLVCDGYSMAMVMRSWSELSRSGKIAGAPPCYDRSVFRPRDPPSYSAKFDDVYAAYDDDRLVNVLTAHDCLVERLYYIEASDMAALRETASTKRQRASRVQAISAYIWKALAGVAAASRVPGERCRMGWWVNGRQRLTAPEAVPAVRSFFGNVTTFAARDAAVEEILREPLAEVAAVVREATTTSAEGYGVYVQELIDWVEQHKTETLVETAALGLGSPTVNLTVMASLGMDTDLGFGQAALAMPVFDYGRLSAGLLSVSALPGAGAGAEGGGAWLVNACVWPRLAAALESDAQRIFKPLTAEYLGIL